MNTFLASRAQKFAEARAFFSERGVIEVDCPAISYAAPIDLHIDVMRVQMKSGQVGYLHTSPEYGMKQLLADGSGDIYQISHVFRDGEEGPLHNPEFTMTEWYRCGFSFQQMIDETLDFIRLFIGPLSSTTITYKAAFQRYLHIDPFTASTEALRSLSGLDWARDALLQYLVSTHIEPHFTDLTVFTYFPPTQAALARTAHIDGVEVACRFEVYYKGIELANGYHELTDPVEQRRRFVETNSQRIAAGKEPLPIDDSFLSALSKGLPDCCGVAVGFDRLFMLHHHLESIHR